MSICIYAYITCSMAASIFTISPSQAVSLPAASAKLPLCTLYIACLDSFCTSLLSLIASSLTASWCSIRVRIPSRSVRSIKMFSTSVVASPTMAVGADAGASIRGFLLLVLVVVAVLLVSSWPMKLSSHMMFSRLRREYLSPSNLRRR